MRILSSRWCLALLLIAGLGVRIAFLRAHVVVLEGEGAGYARQAANLLGGRGFESSLYAKPDLEHCWLQPVLIAGVAVFVGDLDTATHIVSLISGTMLVAVLFFLARRLYGRQAAWIAALITASQPLLIALSTTGYVEILEMAIEFSAIYWSLKFIENDGRWNWLLAGAFWGLSYLNRTECLILPVATVVLFSIRTIWKREPVRRCSMASAFFMIAFLVFATPYILFLYVNTGELRFEGKSLLHYTAGQRVLGGMSLDMASRGLSSNLQDKGPFLDTSAYVSRSPYPTQLHDFVGYFLRMAHRNLKWAVSTLKAHYMGGYPLCLLAIVGLLAGLPWNVNRAFRETYLLGICLYFFILRLGTAQEDPRFGFVHLPFFILWGSVGAVYLASWVIRCGKTAKVRNDVATAGAVVITSCLVLASLAMSYRAIPGLYEITSGWAPNVVVKEAGSWLKREAPGTKTTYGTAVFCYYASSYE